MADNSKVETVDMETWVAARLGRYAKALTEEGIDDPQMIISLLLPYQTYLVSLYNSMPVVAKREVRQ